MRAYGMCSAPVGFVKLCMNTSSSTVHVADVARHLETGQRHVRMEVAGLGLVAERREDRADRRR
jgi:hypothetical protein